jgi:hypothetical protein
LKYTDPSGHNPLLALLAAVVTGGVIGGAIGFVGEASAQVYTEAKSVYDQKKTANEALTTLSSPEYEASRIGAAAGGATSGATLAAIGVATKGKGINPIVYGVVTAASGSIVEPFVAGVAEEHITEGDNFDLGHATELASDRGFLSPKFATSYGIAGAVMGPLGDKVGGAIEKQIGGKITQITGLGVGFDSGRVIIGVGKPSPSIARNAAQQFSITTAKQVWSWISDSTVRKADDSFPK